MKAKAKAKAPIGDVLTVAEAAAILSVAPRVIRGLIASGELAAARLSPRTTRIARSDLMALMRSSARGAA